jgi:hypothetical protein
MSSMPKTSDGSVKRRDEAEWFKHRSCDYKGPCTKSQSLALEMVPRL